MVDTLRAPEVCMGFDSPVREPHARTAVVQQGEVIMQIASLGFGFLELCKRIRSALLPIHDQLEHFFQPAICIRRIAGVGYMMV